MKRILLTSTGFTNKKLEKLFLDHIGKPIDQVRVVFVPTAAVDEEAKSVLPFCRQDLTDAGVLEDNIVTYDLDRIMEIDELRGFDAIYFCGGSETHLMEAVNRANFAQTLLNAVEGGLFYIGVSAGSMIASASVSNGLGIIPHHLEPHCETDITPDGPLPAETLPVNLSDDQAVWITDEGVVILR